MKRHDCSRCLTLRAHSHSHTHTHAHAVAPAHGHSLEHIYSGLNLQVHAKLQGVDSHAWNELATALPCLFAMAMLTAPLQGQDVCITTETTTASVAEWHGTTVRPCCTCMRTTEPACQGLARLTLQLMQLPCFWRPARPAWPAHAGAAGARPLDQLPASWLLQPAGPPSCSLLAGPAAQLQPA